MSPGEILEALGGVGGTSAAALLGFVVVLIFTGRLIPASTHRAILDAKDESIRRLTEQLTKRDQADDAYAELATTTLHILKAIREETSGGEVNETS